MILYYLTLRLKQFFRFFSFNGLHPLVGIVFTIFVFAVVSLLIFEKLPQAPLVYSFLSAAALLELQNRKSNNFFRQRVGRPVFFRAKLVENFVLLLPFILMLLYHKSVLHASVLGLIAIPYSYFSFSLPRPKLKALRSPYLSHSFEYHSGFRLYFFVYILHLLLLVAGLASDNFYLFLVPYFILLFFLQTFYGLVEDVSYIWLYRVSASKFLLSKLRALAINLSISSAPFFLLGLIFYWPHAWFILLSFLFGFIAVTGSMLIKYHFYPNEFIIQISQIIFFGATMATLASPPMIVIVVLFLIFSFSRAKKRLKSVLQC